MILPNVNLERRCNVYGDPNFTEENLFQRDGKIIIEKGELLTGMLDKGTVGNTSGGVVHCIWLDNGIELHYLLMNYRS
jgi:DNA-directed RNA polymerase II subunit RPB1